MKLTAITVALAAAAFGCVSSGAGGGELVAPVSTTTTTGASTSEKDVGKGRVNFYWKSDGGNWDRGNIRATLPDGRVFQGQYLEPSTVTEVEAANFLGWSCGWYDCFGTPGPGPTTVRLYSGSLIARLDDGGQNRMNCRFQLSDPASGPGKGGLGVCTLSTGERITGAELHGD